MAPMIWQGFLLALLVTCCRPAASQQGNATVLEQLQGSCDLTFHQDVSFLGPLQRIAAGNTSFGYYRFGPLGNSSLSPLNSSASTLFVISGLAGTISSLTPTLLRGLAQDRVVFAVDNPGIGFSVDFDNSTVLTIQRQAGAYAALVKALALPSPPHFMGWSMGGAIAIALAALHGEQFGKFVSVSGFAALNTTIGSLPDISNPAELAQSLQAQLFPYTPAGLAGLCNLVQALLSMPPDPPTTDAVTRQIEGLTSYGNGVNALLGNISNPVLLLQGLQDVVIPATTALPMVTTIPQANLVRFPGCGHGLLFQQTDTALTYINTFLDQ